MCHVVISDRVSYGEAVVVLGSNANVLHPCIPGQLSYFYGVELGGIELLGDLFVLCHGDPGASFVHDPFSDAVIGLAIDPVGQVGVEPSVYEHGVVAVGKELTALGILRTELDTGLAPHSIHALGPENT